MKSIFRLSRSQSIWLAILVLYGAGLACVQNGVNVGPDNPQIQEPLVVEGITFTNYVEQLGILPAQSIAPWIVSPIPPPQGSGTLSFSGWGPTQADLNSNDVPTIVLYEVLPDGCDEPVKKGRQLATTTSTGQKWELPNIKIPSDVAVVGAAVRYDKWDGPLGNLLILNSDLLKPILSKPTQNEPVGPKMDFIGQALPGLCIELWRGAQILGKDSVDKDGNWIISSVPIELGENIIEVRIWVHGEYTTYSDYENYKVGVIPQLVWPFGEMENGVYKPDPSQGYITGWYGFNDYYRKNYETLKTNFHSGLDIGDVDNEIVRFVAEGIIYKKYLDEKNDNYCGINVTVIHEGGWLTRYCHLKEIDKKILQSKDGQSFPAGTPLGIVDCTGRTWLKTEEKWVSNCYGSHLHLELIYAYKSVNLNPLKNQSLLAFVSTLDSTSVQELDMKYCHANINVWNLDWSKVKYKADDDYLGTSFAKLTCPTGEICKCEK